MSETQPKRMIEAYPLDSPVEWSFTILTAKQPGKLAFNSSSVVWGGIWPTYITVMTGFLLSPKPVNITKCQNKLWTLSSCTVWQYCIVGITKACTFEWINDQ